MLRQILQNILELSTPHYEARKKFCGTYCIVNGELTYIDDISENFDLYCSNEWQGSHVKVNSEIHSFVPWLPETGISFLGGKTFLITKKPEKQWRKSFNFDLYTVKCLESSVKPHLNVLSRIYKQGIIPSNKIYTSQTQLSLYILNRKIATLVGKVIVDFDSLFKQEIIEQYPHLKFRELL